jgi:pimeloyl-ACP methyl ester carboxylesterase
MPQAEQRTGRLDRGDGVELAWAALAGHGPTVVFLPGFNSDMAGTKGSELAGFCAGSGQAMLRLDYSGHGASGGEFTEGSIGRWTDDALAVIDRCSNGPLLLVGSSMGGWIALLAALARPARVAALVGIAPAPDFTETLMWEAMTLDERATLIRAGELMVPNRYGDPYRVTRRLIEDGRRHLLLSRPIPLQCPVRLLHGQRDEDVPWEVSMRLADMLQADDVQITLIKDGDHRLSRTEDLDLLVRTIRALLGRQDRG